VKECKHAATPSSYKLEKTLDFEDRLIGAYSFTNTMSKEVRTPSCELDNQLEVAGLDLGE